MVLKPHLSRTFKLSNDKRFVEKLEDVIVRSAEQVSGQIRAARDAIATVIFGQERVVENTLVTILSGGHALLIGVPGLAKTKLVETLGVVFGLDSRRVRRRFSPRRRRPRARRPLRDWRRRRLEAKSFFLPSRG